MTESNIQKSSSGLGIAAVMIFCFAMIMAGVAVIMESSRLDEIPITIKISAALLGLSFIAATLVVASLSRISVWNVSAQILPVWFSLTLLIGVIVMGLRLDYSTVFLLINWVAGLGLLILMGRLMSRQPNMIIGVLNTHLTIDGAAENFITLNPDDDIPAELDLIIASTDDMKDARYAAMLSQCAARKIPVLPEQTYQEQQTGRIDHHQVDAAELMQLRPYRRYMVLKRLSDIIMALTGLVLLAPVMVIVALLIKAESSGPAIFVQRRVGEGGREFRMYKFRSMVQDAEKSGAKFATASDARITRLGRLIRKLRIDELPQLINVLMGTMSMIGPRPEQKAFVDDLEKEIPLYPIRHAVRPGITGWAQVMQGYADDVSSTDTKLSYDLFYIKNLSFMMDMVIFFKTIKTILTGFGAR